MLTLNRLLVRSGVIHGQSPVVDIGVTHICDLIIIKSKNTFVLIPSDDTGILMVMSGPPLFGLYPNGLFTIGLFMIGL